MHILISLKQPANGIYNFIDRSYTPFLSLHPLYMYNQSSNVSQRNNRVKFKHVTLSSPIFFFRQVVYIPLFIRNCEPNCTLCMEMYLCISRKEISFFYSKRERVAITITTASTNSSSLIQPVQIYRGSGTWIIANQGDIALA